MILRALIMLACLAPCAAWAAPKPAKPSQLPTNAAEFAQLPALGKLVEGGVDKDVRFRTYLVSKRPTIQGPISIFIGELQIRTQDISPAAPRAVKVENGSTRRAAPVMPIRSA